MFYYLNGEIALIDDNIAVVDCAGVGYACHSTTYTLSKLRVGQKAKLFTYCNIREDAFDIFGFSTREELRCFEKLIGVTGVGPKAALAILSEMDPAKLTLAIAAGDYKAITRAKGVGPKAAQRIVLELKDTVAKGLEGGNASDTFVAAATATAAGNSNAADAVGALVMLGYSQSEAAIAVGKLDQTLSTEELIKQALKQLA